jgi:hypothetical protein
MKLALALFLPTFLFAQTVSNTLTLPITPAERLRWVIESTVMPTSVLGDAVGAGIATGFNSPRELGTHWTGFEKRYFNAMATGLLSHGIEAGLGAATGEDPRYVPAAPGTPFTARVLRTAKWTFLARNANGEMRPAYERFIAVPAAAGISNIWRPDSETGPSHFAERTAFGFAGHWGGNAWIEFWPDVKKKVFRGQ